MSQYKALKPVTHSQTGEYILPGNPVDVSHLSPSQITMLVNMGVLEAQPAETKIVAPSEKPAQEGK